MTPIILTMTPRRPAGAAKYQPRPKIQITRSGCMWRWRLLLSDGQLDSGKARSMVEAKRQASVAKRLWLEASV